jgi:Cytochrome c oxidase subunit IV
MTDEAAVMLRIGAFGIVAAVVYWFLTYEWLGSVALLTLGLGPGFAGWLMARMQADRETEGFGDLVRRFAGAPRQRPVTEDPDLADDEVMVIPSPTIWPFVMSLGFSIALTGLIFGLWLALMGGILAVAGIGGWLASISREYVARRQ